MKFFKVKTDKIEKKVIAGKKTNQTENQLFLEQEENGFIIVEQSELNENVFYYRKKLKSGRKSSRVVFLKIDEIEILNNTKKTEKTEKRKMYATYGTNTKTKKVERIKAKATSKKDFKNVACKNGFKVKDFFIKELEVFEYIDSLKDFNMFAEIFNKSDVENDKISRKKYKKYYEKKFKDISEVENMYDRIITFSTTIELFSKNNKVEFLVNNRTKDLASYKIYNQSKRIEISLNLKLHLMQNLHSLINSIAHEIAHNKYFDHGKEHRALTKKIIENIIEEVGGQLQC